MPIRTIQSKQKGWNLIINGINGFKLDGKLSVASVSELQVAGIAEPTENDSQTLVPTEIEDSEGVVDISQAQTENSDGIKDLLKQLIELLKNVFGGNASADDKDDAPKSLQDKTQPTLLDNGEKKIRLKQKAIDNMVANMTDE